MSGTALTGLTHGGGCACKLSARELAEVIGPLSTHPAVSHPSLLVGVGTPDDAGVWLVRDDLALVQTVDFFTPVVDDPYDWGRIGATNALSDVYAMGGRPITSLQLLGWPRSELYSGEIGSVVEGGADVMAEAGCVIVGGHSIDTPEPTYGFAVTGVIQPGEIVTNAGARLGDQLVLTKPLGIGIITTALKRGVAGPEIVEEAIGVMTSLNAGACEAMLGVGVNAATDVTGFGLLGHLHEMLTASGVGARISASSVPFIKGVDALAEDGVFPGGSARNLEAAEEYTIFGNAPKVWRMILADAQTSGGLLISVSPEKSDRLMAALDRAGVPGAELVGEIIEGPPSILLQG